jgi:hypothetical protein
MNITTHEQDITTQDDARIANGEREPREGQIGVPQLFPVEASAELRSRWDRVQTGFVDSPRKAVQEADQLVADAIQRLSARFSDERNRLEQQWDRGDQVNTEELRVALQSYRAFFHRILST